ncbi:MAG: dihydrodipicolinate synthase family protein, partial [Phycisphaeraceae bacterium]
QQIGATAISANAPSYFKVQSADMLARCMAEIASGAPDLPFYYYHIPALTGVSVDMLDYLDRAAASTPTFAGVKYTVPTLDEYQELMAWDDGRLDVLWGCDEMLLPALAVGSQGAVGSTYNLFSPIYRQVLAAFEAGDLVTARAAQAKAIQVIRTIKRFPFHSAMKQIFTMRGIDCGPCRSPQPALSSDDVRDLRAALESLGLLENATVSVSTSQE